MRGVQRHDNRGGLPPLLLAVLAAAIGTGVGIAANVLTNNFRNPWAWVVVGILVLALGSVTYYETERSQPKLVSSDALAEAAVLEFATWPWLTTNDPEYVIERLREVLKEPAFLSKSRARKVLNEIERIYALRTAQREQLLKEYEAEILKPLKEQHRAIVELNPGARVCLELVEPLQKALPTQEELLKRLELLPDEERRSALVRGYYRHTQSDRSLSDSDTRGNPLQSDVWATYFLDLLHRFAYREDLLRILDERMEQKDEMPWDAIQATVSLAQRTLTKGEFENWLRRVWPEAADQL
jgi:hypothetical protein